MITSVQDGFDKYESGFWLEAKGVFEQTYTMLHDSQGNVIRDGPSRALMEFMSQTGYVAPGNWAGFRELTDK